MKGGSKVRLTAVIFSAVASLALSSSAAGLQSIDDVRVDALVSSHWGQGLDTGYSNSGRPCFNYSTPNNYPCGCVATPMAQLFRYWRYPASVQAGTSRCLVDGLETLLPYGGVEYDYDAMPYVAAGASESSRAAIGRLTADCAAALHSMFYSGSTLAYGMFAFVQLRETFGYSSSVGYVPIESRGPSAALENTIVANLDAKCPVMISLRVEANEKAHQALIDGYGYHEGKLYFHFNLGWCNVRGDDAWYELDKTTDQASGSYYNLIEGLIYNIFPDFSGDVLSGRVLDEYGNPVANATVQALRNGEVVDTAQTDGKGIYAFVLDGGATYKVVCEGHALSVFLPSSASAKLRISAKADGKIWADPFKPSFNVEGTLGGSSGNDIELSGEVSALGAFNPSKAGKGAFPHSGAVYDELGNPCGTMTVKFTKPSKGVSKISASLRLLDGKTYSLKATPAAVDETGPARIVGATIKKLGVFDVLEVGEEGFTAEITAADGTRMTAVTTNLSEGLAQGDYKFSVNGLPAEINGLPVVSEMLPVDVEFTVNTKGKISLAKAAKLKYTKVKGSKPAVYELVSDTSKGKTNLSGLKLTYAAKTASIKGSFSVYTDNPAKHKINKISFTVTGMVIGGKAVGVATCKKLAISCPIVIEKL